MSEKIKMTESELVEVKSLQDKYQQKVVQLGRLYLQKMQSDLVIKNISEQEIKLRDDWTALQKLESELIDTLIKKYGEGSMDLQEGVFISQKSVSPTS